VVGLALATLALAIQHYLLVPVTLASRHASRFHHTLALVELQATPRHPTLLVGLAAEQVEQVAQEEQAVAVLVQAAASLPALTPTHSKACQPVAVSSLVWVSVVVATH
jgi:hypothetical protein